MIPHGAERDGLRKAYQPVLIEADLLRRKIFVTKAERIDTRQLELEFAHKNAQLMGLAAQLEQSEAASSDMSPRRSTGGADMPLARHNVVQQRAMVVRVAGGPTARGCAQSPPAGSKE